MPFRIVSSIAALASNLQKYEPWNHSSHHSHPRTCWSFPLVGAQQELGLRAQWSLGFGPVDSDYLATSWQNLAPTEREL